MATEDSSANLEYIVPENFRPEDKWPIHITIEEHLIMGELYSLVKIDIDPSRPFPVDGDKATQYASYLRSYADFLLQRVQRYLAKIHIDHGKTGDDQGIGELILNSFQQAPSSMKRVEWSDTGTLSHKVDDYFENRSLIVFLTKYNDISDEGFIGTVKFVMTSVDRVFDSALREYEGVFSPVLVQEMDDSATKLTMDVEYENLAKTDGIPSPVDFLLFQSASTGWFSFIWDQRYESTTYLNAESHILDFHANNFGFSDITDFYEGLAAHKMQGDTRNFLKIIEQRYTAKMEAANSGDRPGFVAFQAPVTVVDGSFSEIDLELFPLPGSDQNSIISLIAHGYIDPSNPYGTMIKSGWRPQTCEMSFNRAVPFY